MEHCLACGQLPRIAGMVTVHGNEYRFVCTCGRSGYWQFDEETALASWNKVNDPEVIEVLSYDDE